MLDLKVWKEEGQNGANTIRHTFYDKDVASPLVFHSRGAHTWRSKLVTLAEEIRRRLKNMDRAHIVPQVIELNIDLELFSLT